MLGHVTRFALGSVLELGNIFILTGGAIIFGFFLWLILTPVIMGAIVSELVADGVKKGRCRNATVALAIGGVGGSASIVFMVSSFLLLSHTDLKSYLGSWQVLMPLLMHEVWDPGPLAWILLAVEVIVGAFAGGVCAAAPRARQPYCEACDTWLSGDVIFRTPETHAEAVLSSLRAGTLAGDMRRFPAAPSVHRKPCTVRKYTCPRCGITYATVDWGGAVKASVRADETRGMATMPRDEQLTGMVNAVLLGDAATVEDLLRSWPAMANAMNTSGMTSLMAAAGTGHRDLAERLIAAGADVNLRNDGCGKPSGPPVGYPPLHWATQKGSPGVLELLLASGADANAAVESGITPLHWAAAAAAADLAELLIAGGANIHAQTTGDLLVPRAKQEGQTKAPGNVIVSAGVTPLRVAREGNYQAVESLLRSKGAAE